MTTFTGKSKNRIVVWQTESIARSADTEETGLCKRMTVWRTYEEAAENTTLADAPEWVPENAKIHIDFVNDRAWTEADGEVAIDTLVGADPNAETYWGGDASYDNDDLTADGFLASHAAAFIGDTLARVLSGFTAVMTTKNVGSGGSVDTMVLVSESAFIGAGTSGMTSARVTVADVPGETFANIVNVGVGSAAVGAVNRSAFTLVPPPGGRADIAYNGSAASTESIDANDWPEPVAALFQLTSSVAMQTITIYDPLPDADGLSELSDV